MVENDQTCTTSWLLVLTQMSQSGQILTLNPSSGVMEDAVRVLQQQVNEFTDFDNQENVPSVDTLELTLFDVESESSPRYGKVAQKRESSQIQI